MKDELFARRLATEWCFINGLLCPPGTHGPKDLDITDQLVFTDPPGPENICTGDGEYGKSPLEMLAGAADPDAAPRIVSITTELDDVITTWETGDPVEINHPEHQDHGGIGSILAFEVVISRFRNGNGQGMVHPIVLLKDTHRICVIPFTRLNKHEIEL
jgi:hypothetical protein